MYLLLKLAFRNIFRNFRRSLLTFLTISIGIALAIIFIGFAIGAEYHSLKLSAETYSGHVKIYSDGYISDDLTITLDHTIENYERTIGVIRNNPGVISYSERILFPSSLTDSMDELKLTGVGIDPDREDEVFGLRGKVVEGEYIKSGEERLLLPKRIADLFKVGAGDYLTMISRTKYGTINAIDLEIAGIVDVDNPEVDNQYYFIPLDISQEFLDMQNMITEVSIMGNSMNDAAPLAASFSAELPDSDYDIVTWEYISRDLIRLYEFRGRARAILIFVILLMASAGVMNTMLMAIFERTKEIGAVMAMGMRSSGIRTMFMLEGMFLGVFGSFVGCILGGSFTYYYKFNGIDVSTMYDTTDMNLPVAKYIYTEITMEYIIAAFLLGVVIAVLSAAYPSVKGSRLQPADALRFV